jgi:hypothetical protein
MRTTEACPEVVEIGPRETAGKEAPGAAIAEVVQYPQRSGSEQFQPLPDADHGATRTAINPLLETVPTFRTIMVGETS